jgi:hypothetical protein
VAGDKWGIGKMKIEYLETLLQIGEMDGASPDDLKKWEAAKIAINSYQFDIKNVNRAVGKKYRNDQEQ